MGDMMIFTRLELKNFKSHANTVLDFNQGISLIVGENGAGKSSLFEAISYAFELLTSPDYFDIDKDKLYITVYPTDEETYNIWLSLGIKESHLIKLESNYWEIGPGPSGP